MSTVLIAASAAFAADALRINMVIPYSWKMWHRKLNLVVWWSIFATVPNCILSVYVYMYVQQSLTKLPNLNAPIFFSGVFGSNSQI